MSTPLLENTKKRKKIKFFFLLFFSFFANRCYTFTRSGCVSTVFLPWYTYYYYYYRHHRHRHAAVVVVVVVAAAAVVAAAVKLNIDTGSQPTVPHGTTTTTIYHVQSAPLSFVVAVSRPDDVTDTTTPITKLIITNIIWPNTNWSSSVVSTAVPTTYLLTYESRNISGAWSAPPSTPDPVIFCSYLKLPVLV